MNLYRGCSHGCIYCDSRSECYRIGDFSTVRKKANALSLLREELRHKTKKGVIGAGSMSDPYNPFEKQELLTRGALKLADEFSFGVTLATKSGLIVRDKELLSSIQRHSPVLCMMTVTAAEDELCRKLEPNVSLTGERLVAVETLSAVGIFTGILMTPILPFLEDNSKNVIQIVRRAKECGAKFVYAMFGVTLRGSQKEYFLSQLEEAFPGQGLRKKYELTYGNEYFCACQESYRLWNVFEEECSRQGLLCRMEEIVRAYQGAYEMEQERLF